MKVMPVINNNTNRQSKPAFKAKIIQTDAFVDFIRECGNDKVRTEVLQNLLKNSEDIRNIKLFDIEPNVSVTSVKYSNVNFPEEIYKVNFLCEHPTQNLLKGDVTYDINPKEKSPFEIYSFIVKGFEDATEKVKDTSTYIRQSIDETLEKINK